MVKKKKITKKEQDAIDKQTINDFKKSFEENKNPLDDGDLNDLFKGELGNERDIAKELFAQNNVDTKTELNDLEIRGISVLSFYADYIGFEQLNSLINRFLRLKISRKRKSRQEFVEVLKGLENNNNNFNPFGMMKQ